MAGMKNRGEGQRRGRFDLNWVVVFFLTALVAEPSASATPQDEQDKQGGGTADAFVVSLAAGDLNALAAGLEEGLLGAPISGHTDERFEQDLWFSTVGVEGASYQFRLKNLSLVPQLGRLSLSVEVEDLSVNVDKIYFGSPQGYYCNDMPLTSDGEAVPVRADVTPRAADRTLDLAASAVRVGLSSGNFAAGQPAECHIFFGASWLVRHALPYVAELVRPALAHAIERRIAAMTSEIGGSVNGLLNAAITLPVDVKPVPAFYASVALWPSSVTLSDDRAEFKLGADVTFDRDAPQGILKHGPLIAGAKEKALALVDPSWVGIGRALFAAIIKEANGKGLFNVALTPASLPAASDLFDVVHFAGFLPDAASRFRATDAVAVSFAGADDTSVVFNPNGPGGIPIIEVSLSGLATEVSIAGAPYYRARLDLHAAFKTGLDPVQKKFVLALAALDASYRDGGFDEHLEPQPADDRFLAENFALFSKILTDRVRGAGADFFAVTLPDIEIGRHVLAFLRSSVREDFVTLDAQVRVEPSVASR